MLHMLLKPFILLRKDMKDALTRTVKVSLIGQQYHPGGASQPLDGCEEAFALHWVGAGVRIG